MVWGSRSSMESETLRSIILSCFTKFSDSWERNELYLYEFCMASYNWRASGVFFSSHAFVDGNHHCHSSWMAK